MKIELKYDKLPNYTDKIALDWGGRPNEGMHFHVLRPVELGVVPLLTFLSIRLLRFAQPGSKALTSSQSKFTFCIESFLWILDHINC